jgi:hypothetical protein
VSRQARELPCSSHRHESFDFARPINPYPQPSEIALVRNTIISPASQKRSPQATASVVTISLFTGDIGQKQPAIATVYRNDTFIEAGRLDTKVWFFSLNGRLGTAV